MGAPARIRENTGTVGLLIGKSFRCLIGNAYWEFGTVLAFDASRRKKGGEERGEEGEREDSLWKAPTKIGFVLCNSRFL